MDTNRIIEILEDVTMIDHRGAINAADGIMDQLMAEQRAAVDELTAARAEVDALRAALQSLVDGKSEYGVAQVAGVDATEARRIMDLTYNRK